MRSVNMHDHAQHEDRAGTPGGQAQGRGRKETATLPAEHPRSGLRIAMALYGDLTYDSRVLREAATLSESGHDVAVCCLGGTSRTHDAFRVIDLMPSGASVLPDGASPFLQAGGPSTASRLAGRLRWIVGYARALRSWGRSARYYSTADRRASPTT